MYTLGIETSCDDTSLALVNSKGQVKALEKWTADSDHIPFGGIIPERASRNHLKTLVPVLEKLLKKSKVDFDQIEAVAVTNRPGLVGSLIVGLVSAKTLCLCYKKPLVTINHLEGHLLSPWLVGELEQPLSQKQDFPQISLIASGGHTQLVLVKALGDYRILGATRDDAVGEAIDKFSNKIGLGFPGGPKVDAKAQKGNAKAYTFPKPMIKEPHYHFSFSGLKASGARLVDEILKREETLNDEVQADLCASYLEAAVSVLSHKLELALLEFKPKSFSVVGGVSANSQLRAKLEHLSLKTRVPFYKPHLKYCTDNGAMIALAGALRFQKGWVDHDFSAAPSARSLKGDFSL